MYDVVIIGAGPAGISAALWCSDLGLDTLLLEQEKEIGGQLLSVYNMIENYIGLFAKNGSELLELFSQRTTEADFDLWTNVEIDSANLGAKQISLRSGEQLKSICIVIATGVRRRQLGIPGETQFIGRGIIESATRDRELFSGMDVCVVGGGDAAVENALLLAEVCSTVTVVHRGRTLSARQDFVQRLQPQHNVTVFTESVVTRILGDEKLEAVEIRRRESIKPFQMAVRGLLIRIGVEPNTEMFRNELRLDEKNYIAITSEQETSVKNVFAIGDVANPLAPTISGATGEGATAAKVIASRLSKKKVSEKPYEAR